MRHVQDVRDGPARHVQCVTGYVQGVHDVPGHVQSVRDVHGHVTGPTCLTGPDCCCLTGGWSPRRGWVMTRMLRAGTGYHCPR